MGAEIQKHETQQVKSGKVKASMEMFLREEKERREKFYWEQMSFLNEEEKESQEVIKDVDGDQPQCFILYEQIHDLF